MIKFEKVKGKFDEDLAKKVVDVASQIENNNGIIISVVHFNEGGIVFDKVSAIIYYRINNQDVSKNAT